MSDLQYVHGYSPREAERLRNQANSLSALLHDTVRYARGHRVLEVACGTGAQTVFLAANSPEADIVSADISPASLAQARQKVEAAGHRNVRLQLADLFDLPFDDASFDDLFVCFVLEHLPEPEKALRAVTRVLRPGGGITVIEGDHGSWYCHPHTELAIALGLMTASDWDKGIAEMYRAAEPGGTFCYTFFRGTGVRP